MQTEHTAIMSIVILLQSWKGFSVKAHKCKPGSAKYEALTSMINKLCDLADGDEEHVKAIMHATTLPTWERDFQFSPQSKGWIE